MDIHFARSQLHTLVPIGVLAELAWGTCSTAYQVCSYSSRQKKLTFCCISNIISMSIPFVSSSFCIVHTHAHQLFLRSRKLLIGRHDRTAVIACSPCRVEEAIFQEVVSNRKAQRSRGLDGVADIERRPSCPFPGIFYSRNLSDHLKQ